jgi:methylglyoxal synthase
MNTWRYLASQERETVLPIPQDNGASLISKKEWPTMPNVIPIVIKKRIALVAHDNKKKDLLEWARFNRDLLVQHELCATGTTGMLLELVLGTGIEKLRSGPLGGDQQIGAKIAEGEIDFIMFFWDPLEPQPHDPDVKALLRLAVVWNIPVACNRATADFMISSHLMNEAYERILPDFTLHVNRFADGPPLSDVPAIPLPDTMSPHGVP